VRGVTMKFEDSLHFTEPQGSLQCSQQPATCFYSEPGKPNQSHSFIYRTSFYYFTDKGRTVAVVSFC